MDSLDGEITGTVIAGNTVFEKCTISLCNKIMRIEKPILIENRRNENIPFKSKMLNSFLFHIP